MSYSEFPQFTLEQFNESSGPQRLLHDVVDKYGMKTANTPAMIDADRASGVTWLEFMHATRAVAALLLKRGLRKGDFFASIVPLNSEHLILEYACFRIGVIFVPLDMRLGQTELMRCLRLLPPAAVAFGKAPAIPDLAAFSAALKQEFAPKLLVQFGKVRERVGGATLIESLIAGAYALAAEEQAFGDAYDQAVASVTENDPALVIFTTGSTGSPKAALLSHHGILCQNFCLSNSLLHNSSGALVTLVNLPPSHVGCQTELLMSTFFAGGTAVLLPAFDPARSLQAIAEYKVTAIGQIPAMFQFEWLLKDYATFNLTSLEFAAYGGQSVAPAFLERMAQMAPNIGTGLGLTEASGFCTYIRRPAAQAAECATSLGAAMPLYPLSIRKEMQASGAAGEELPQGELGHVCFRGPQTFLGYVNDSEATKETLSSDGFLYTGDMGRVDATGALQLAGRVKHVLKPSGYQVFPGDVENHFTALEGVAACAVVGVEHEITSEAIVAFVELEPGKSLTVSDLHRHARELAGYMRPYHFVVLEPGQMPLNRVSKADYAALQERAKQEIAGLKHES
ncbi:MAG: class I adenylate-forming enzyme family protein [Acidobacteriota bacterium]|nr:class I adenylate-forming enzyme family protein [Acidobacteriota bacterium]